MMTAKAFDGYSTGLGAQTNDTWLLLKNLVRERGTINVLVHIIIPPPRSEENMSMQYEKASKNERGGGFEQAANKLSVSET
mmetsp:Transcript_12538/g.25004  ORF Transcript_12538/g.25004 Transcript_12538/m.25004 type:complete len:81 (+) Transcript_12538:87-329(+)